MKISKNHKWGKPYKRKLHIGDEVWTYRIGGGYVIMIRSPDGKKTFRTDSFELNETTEEEWYDYDSLDLDEDHPAPIITPRLIKDFVVARCK